MSYSVLGSVLDCKPLSLSHCRRKRFRRFEKKLAEEAYNHKITEYDQLIFDQPELPPIIQSVNRTI